MSMRSRRMIKHKEGARRDHRSNTADDDSTASELLVMQTPTHEELFRDDDSELLLSAASRLLCKDSSNNSNSNSNRSSNRSSGINSSICMPASIDGFPSFQALLQAATSVVAVDRNADAPLQPIEVPAVRVNAHTQKRRERNRISCRKTRLKRKVEQASEDLLASERAEHNRFLSEMHHALVQAERDQQQQQQYSDSRELGREQKAREFITRSLLFQLMDPEHDASWCFESTSGHASRRDGCDANDTLLEQWHVIVGGLENANLEILQVQEVGSQFQYVVNCQWRLVGLSKQQLQSGRVEKVVLFGATNVRFRGRSIESIDMRVI